MQIQGPLSLHGAHSVNAPHRSASSQPTQQSNSSPQTDQLDISREAELISQLRDVPDVRADRVAHIRAQIESGVYETGDKLDLALDRLLDEIG